MAACPLRTPWFPRCASSCPSRRAAASGALPTILPYAGEAGCRPIPAWRLADHCSTAARPAARRADTPCGRRHHTATTQALSGIRRFLSRLDCQSVDSYSVKLIWRLMISHSLDPLFGPERGSQGHSACGARHDAVRRFSCEHACTELRAVRCSGVAPNTPSFEGRAVQAEREILATKQAGQPGPVGTGALDPAPVPRWSASSPTGRRIRPGPRRTARCPAPTPE